MNPEWTGESWLLSCVMGTGASQAVGVALWSVSIVGFVPSLPSPSAGRRRSGGRHWPSGQAWRRSPACCSFPLAFPMTSTIGACLVDVAVLVAGLRFELTDATI